MENQIELDQKTYDLYKLALKREANSFYISGHKHYQEFITKYKRKLS